MMSRI
jgi:hypothetical protein